MRYGFLFLFCGWLSQSAYGQIARSDSALLATATQFAITRYEQSRGGNEQLFNGIEHVGYDPRLKGNPYFQSDSIQTGTVLSNTNVFSIRMLYDIVRDVVVVEHPAGYRMSMNGEKVQSFSFLNHSYVWLADSASRGFTTGYYDRLYNGATPLLARRTKVVVINPSQGNGYGLFDPKTAYYIRKDGRYQPVKTKKMLLKVLVDRKKQLVAYARKQKLRFRPDPETAIIQLTQYYDELTTSL